MVSGYIFLKEERYRSVMSAQVPDTPVGKGEGWGGTWGLACEGFCEGEVLREVLHGKKYLKMENRGFSSPSHTLGNCHIPKQEHSLRNLILPLTIHLSTCTV